MYCCQSASLWQIHAFCSVPSASMRCNFYERWRWINLFCFIIVRWTRHEFLVALSFLPGSCTLGELSAQNTLLVIILFACSSLCTLAAWVQPYFYEVLLFRLFMMEWMCWKVDLEYVSVDRQVSPVVPWRDLWNLMNFYSVGWQI